MNVAFDSTPIEILTRFEYPAGTWRRNDVNATSARRINVSMTSFQSYVPTG